MGLRKRMRRARRRYLAKRTNTRLRRYLTLKARLRIFDKRMCAFYGVSPRVSRPCQRAICRAYAAGLVPTSTTGGRHAPGSYHGQKDRNGRGRAVDIGVRNLGSAQERQRLSDFHRKEFWRARQGKISPVELIGPHNGMTILRGNRTVLAEGSSLEQAHDNHVHEAF